jgi:hypothetical protein
MPEILITITRQGKVTVEAIGYEGPSCSLKTQPFIKALGVKTGELPKPEMFVETSTQQSVSQQA